MLVFYSSRDASGRSLITSVELDAKDPRRVLAESDKSLLPLGGPGAFDEFGVMPSAAIQKGNDIWLYTIGWQRGQTVPYINAIGLAVSKDGGMTFERPFVGPLLGCTPLEPFSTMSPCIFKQGSTWRMCYGSGVEWLEVNGKFEPVYIIKQATSEDGVSWVRDGQRCVTAAYDHEASTRPTVIEVDGEYKMWFSHRGSYQFRGGADSYKMGFVTSRDGHSWTRDDASSGIQLGAPGEWDSEMMAYPNVIQTDYGTYLFYNGNAFGRHGFGYAVWKD